MKRMPAVLALPFALLSVASLPRVQEIFLPNPGVVRELVAESRAKPPAEPVVHEDLVYRKRLFGSRRLDVYEPTVPFRSGEAPVVVFLHGGSWLRGDKITIRVVDRFLSRMRAAGYFVVAVNYTASVLRGLRGPVENTVDALRWVAAHADEYGFDPANVGLYGVSAGGHVALMVASGEPVADVDLAFAFIECAPTDLVAMRDGEGYDSSRVFRLFAERRLVALSPITHVGPRLPPVLVFHGDQDRTVHVNQSIRYVDALREAGGEAELVRYPQGDHAFLNMSDEQWYEQETRALRFFAARFAGSPVSSARTPERSRTSPRRSPRA